MLLALVDFDIEIDWMLFKNEFHHESKLGVVDLHGNVSGGVWPAQK